MSNTKRSIWRTWKQAWFKMINAGDIQHSYNNSSRRTFIINLFCLVGVLFTAPLGLVALWQANFLVAFGLLGIAVLYSANHIYLRKTRNYLLSANVILYPLYALMLYLVYSGGVHGTGHVWIYCIPPVSLFLHGLKRGLLEVFLFILALIFLLFYMETPFDQLGYHPDLKTRIVYSFILIAFLSTIYEYISSRFTHSLQDLSMQLELAAKTDPLTGLLNRRGLEQHFKENDWAAPAILLLDVDYFKRINDRFGHHNGDLYLQAIAQRMKGFCNQQSSLLSRWGGEEFLVVFKSQDDLLRMAEALRKTLADVIITSVQGDSISTTSSIGVAKMRIGEDLLKVVSRADKALYKAKENGRNQVLMEENV